MITIDNVDSVMKALTDHIDKTAKEAEAIRRKATSMLVEELIANIPVWSGRTVRSVRVNNSGAVAPSEPDPHPSEWTKFGYTRVMKMGTEPMRPAATAIARAQVAQANYSFNMNVFITINSKAWGLVEQAKAPDGRGRNKAVVSAIALAKVKAAFPQLG